MIGENLAAVPALENLGWTLLHSLWQIALVAAWLFLMLRAATRSTAEKRYWISLSALVLVLILPVATFIYLSQTRADAAPDSFDSKRGEAAFYDEKITAAEKTTAPEILENQNAGRAIFFDSVEHWQSDLAKNFRSFAPLVAGLWLLGVAFSAARLAGGVRQLRIYQTRETSAPPAVWQRNFASLSARLKVKRAVRLVESNLISVPMVVGWLKPMVLVPAGVFLQMNPREIETILAHELEHVRRADYPVNFLQTLVEILFFYHPAARWISANIRRERECACDDAVVKILEDSNIVYANALANLEEFRQQAKQTRSPVLVAATSSGGNLMKRIERIIGGKNETAATGGSRPSLWSASLISAVISALVFGLFSAMERAPANAQTKIVAGKDKKLAVGFVSIPPLDRSDDPPKDADATARLLIEKLKAHKVPAIGFVNGSQISDGEKLYPVRAEIVRTWRDAGFEIGIGGYKHIWFHDTPLDEYIRNAEKNERVTKKILAEKNLSLRYFSHPFLNTGKTAEDKNQFEAWLAARDLKSVKYTFDNQEWVYSFAYDMARKDNDINTMREIRRDYLDYMTRMLDHYEAYSADLFGRDIAQTLVLTASRLICDTADEFFGMLTARGYRFVSMDEAQVDAAYQTREKHVETHSGISWFERWQMAHGKKLLDEPPVHASVWKTWQERKDKK